ncbi:hypothetical protein ACFBZI_11980 [Moraxella sp. ZJ142]|uniref:hypothetical protein n=1 Tax=Moraxella marmotae TaxID=3344520 RepID=UPI0035D4EB9A
MTTQNLLAKMQHLETEQPSITRLFNNAELGQLLAQVQAAAIADNDQAVDDETANENLSHFLDRLLSIETVRKQLLEKLDIVEVDYYESLEDLAKAQGLGKLKYEHEQ